MRYGLTSACERTGFVPEHARACESVADRLDCIILFREPGTAAQGLIEESYGMKGFRIDVKSCDWGPMCGFVCCDPRLSKKKSEQQSNVEFNTKYREEALHGGLGGSFVRPSAADLAAWKADVMPIVISEKRIQWLVNSNKIAYAADRDGTRFGVSTQEFAQAAVNNVTLPWRLVPTGNATNPWLKVNGESSAGHYVVCVDTQQKLAFQQKYPLGVGPVRFRGYETILGMINPGTQGRGFKACVTADYDLFAVFPSIRDQMAWMHNVMRSQTEAPLPGGVPRLFGVDDRLRQTRTVMKDIARPTEPDEKTGVVPANASQLGQFEHYRFGDVSARIMTVKTLLNSAIMGAGYRGGNAIHHSDEAGNQFLAKANLNECLPLIVFIPKAGEDNVGTIAIESAADFKQFFGSFVKGKYRFKGKRAWASAANISPQEYDLRDTI